MLKFAHETLTLPPLLLKEVTMTENTGFFKVQFPRKSQDALEEQLFGLRRSPAPWWHHGKVSSAHLCPALALPELVVTEVGGG